MIDSFCVEGRGYSDYAVDDVGFLEEKFGFVHELHGIFLTTNYADYTNYFFNIFSRRIGAKFLRL